MDDKAKKTLFDIESALDTLLMGKIPEQLSETEEGEALLTSVVSKLNKLFRDFQEIDTMADDLVNGKVDGYIPPRQNILAAKLKMLHSNLSNLVWSAQELAKGKVVSKLDSDKDNALYESFNTIVDKVAEASIGSTSDSFALIDNDEQKVNSWRYHQILTAVNMLDIQVVEVDDSGKIVYVNTPAKKMLKGLTHLAPHLVTEDTNVLIAHISTHGNMEGQFPVEEEVYDEAAKRWYRVTSDTFSLPNGQHFYLHVTDDITDWKNTEERLEFSANFDSLTGTLNRRAGLKMLKLLNERHLESTSCIAFIDVDGLKEVNDTYGHGEGDEYLKIIANILVSFSRSSESVVRYGGDEFFILFKNCPLDVAQRILGRMQEKLSQMNEEKVKPYHLSFSYGVEEFGAGIEQTPEELLEKVDFKMYQNKAKKKKKATNRKV